MEPFLKTGTIIEYFQIGEIFSKNLISEKIGARIVAHCTVLVLKRLLIKSSPRAYPEHKCLIIEITYSKVIVGQEGRSAGSYHIVGDYQREIFSKKITTIQGQKYIMVKKAFIV